MSPAPETRSPLGTLGPLDAELLCSDPAQAAGLLAELDAAARMFAGVASADPRHRMLAVSISLARQIHLTHLHRARSVPLPSQEYPP